jgi:hypothetical protein
VRCDEVQCRSQWVVLGFFVCEASLLCSILPVAVERWLPLLLWSSLRGLLEQHQSCAEGIVEVVRAARSNGRDPSSSEPLIHVQLYSLCPNHRAQQHNAEILHPRQTGVVVRGCMTDAVMLSAFMLSCFHPLILSCCHAVMLSCCDLMLPCMRCDSDDRRRCRLFPSLKRIPTHRAKGVLATLYLGGVLLSGLYGAVRGVEDFAAWSRKRVPRKMKNKTLEPSECRCCCCRGCCCDDGGSLYFL